MKRYRMAALVLTPLLSLFYAASLAQSSNLPIAAYLPTSEPLPVVNSQSIGSVSVTTDKSEYDVSETILAKVTNGLDRTIATWDHQSFCSILTLQKLEPTGSWVDIAPCPLETPTRLVRIGPHIEALVKFPPGNSPGIYRLRLTWQFVDNNGQPTGNPMTTYSPQFRITLRQ
jgi:hypothetical protein